MADTREHTVIDKEVVNENTLITEFIKIAPFITSVLLVSAAFFNLQGQVIELRARYESSAVTNKEALSDMRDDIKETNTLVRRLLDRIPNNAYDTPKPVQPM